MAEVHGTFTLKVVIPEGVFAEAKVDSVSLPSVQGEIGVLPQHTRYTGIVGTGLLTYTPSGTNTPVSMVVAGGFASFLGETLTVLADSVDSADTPPPSFASKRSELEKKVAELSMFDPEWEFAKSRLERLDAREKLKPAP